LNSKKYNIRFILTFNALVISAVILMLIFSGCYENAEIAKKLGQADTAAQANATDGDIISSGDSADSGPNLEQDQNPQDLTETPISKGTSPTAGPPLGGFSTQKIEGLHVTGTQIDIDIESYRLKVTGLVENELSLTFEEIKAMPSARVFAVLDCPGFFVDEGYWTGVEISYLLDKAGLKKEEANTLVLSDYENGYSKKIDIEMIEQEGFLVAYHFNDSEFLPIHGFPLRIVAKGQYGSVWVKWLGEIKVE